MTPLKRLVVFLIFIPYYLFAMFGEFYLKMTGYGGKFSLWKTTKEYFTEAWELMTNKRR